VSAGRVAGVLLGLGLYYALLNAGSAARARAAGALTAAGVVLAVAGLLGADWSLAPALAGGWLTGVYGALSALGERLPGEALARALELSNPRDVGGVLALVLPVTVVRLWSGRHGARPGGLALAGAAVVLMLVVLLLSQSVSAAGGVLLALWLSAVIG